MAEPMPVNTVARLGLGTITNCKQDLYPKYVTLWVKVFFITLGEQQPRFLATSSEVITMNRLKTTFLLSLLTVLMVLMGSAIGGKSGMVFAFFMAAAMVAMLSAWSRSRVTGSSGF